MPNVLAPRGWVYLFFLALPVSPAVAQPRYFTGAGGGIAALSGGGSSTIGAQASAISLYKPGLGPAVHAYFGRHAWEYVGVQAAWSWNRNPLTFSSSASLGDGPAAVYEQKRSSSQHGLGADVLLYFRERRSFIRPFLAVGVNWMRLESKAQSLSTASGPVLLPPAAFTANKPGLRAAAGIDLMHRSGWGLRYAFLETIQANAIGARLAPRTQGALMNFQNQFSLVKYF